MNVAEAEITHAEELARLERTPRPEKVAEVERLQGILKESASIFLTDFRGINVEMMNDLRRRFREADVEFTIVKNNLLKRAADKVDLKDWIADLEGPTAITVSVEDPVAPAKVIKGFQDDYRRQGDLLDFKAGLLEGEVIEVDVFKRLAALPGHDELIAKLLYILSYPLRGLVNVIAGVPRNLVYALEDLRKKREAAEPSVPVEETSPEPVESIEDSEETSEEVSESAEPEGEIQEIDEGAEVAAGQENSEDESDESDGSEETTEESEKITESDSDEKS